MRKKALFFLVIFFLIVFLSLLFTLFSRKNQRSITEEPKKISKDRNLDYSSLNKVTPGRTTFEDLKRINGNPDSVEVKGEKTYAYYKTPLSGFTNTVLLKENKVIYSEENVFGSYRGNFQSLTETYGNPSLILFRLSDEVFPWYIYLNQGFGFQTDEEDVLVMIYFVPQDRDAFMKGVAKEVGLVQTLPDHIESNPEL